MSSRIVSLAPASMSRFAGSPADVVSWAAKAGFSHVGLRVVTGVANPDNPMLPGRPMMRETRTRLDGEGITPFEIEVVRLDASSKPGEFEAALESAALLGGKHLVVICDDPDISRVVENFGALCDLCARFSLTANIEPTSYYVINSIAKAKAVVEAAGRPNGAVVPDPLHFYRAEDSFDDLKSLGGRFINATQLCDAPVTNSLSAEQRMAEARGERLPPGEGGLDLKRYLDALDPSLPLSIEVPMTKLLDSIGPEAVTRRLKDATTAFLDEIGRAGLS